MGRMLIETALAAEDLTITAALERPEAPQIGQDCGLFLGRKTGVNITSDLASIARADVLIDFTRPEGTLRHLEACVQHGVRAVIGTTGFDDAGRRQIEQAAGRVPLVFSPNMSVGVNVTFRLVELAARMLAGEFDVEIIEAHHRHKIDAPSGTALMLGEAAAAGRKISLDAHSARGRDGQTGARGRGDIGFASLRGGTVTGDHSVIFAGAMERIELTHRAEDRTMFAQGAMKAALWARDKKPGLYSMADVLGLGEF